jgi:hypothetical protein
MQQAIVGLSSKICSELVLRQWVGKPSLAKNRLREITPGKSASIRQPHCHRHLAEKR